MHYLTVQDVIWIHLQITKNQEAFSFANLEEATSYQYAYGKSHDVLAQAARFVPGFVAKSPFATGNRAVAFASGIVFLELNGLHFNPNAKDLVDWFGQASNPTTSRASIESAIEKNPGIHHATARTVAEAVIAQYEATIKKLLE